MTTRLSPLVAHEALGHECGLRDGCVTASVYSTVADEYDCVRNRVGMQDLSHYGKVAVSGAAALSLLDQVLMTNLTRLPINQLQASFILDDAGRPVCECYVANFGDSYLVLSEGAAPAAIAELLTSALPGHPGATVEDRSEALGLLSVDGPYAWELLKVFLGLGIIGTRYLEVAPKQSIGGVDVTLARAGKTGEYGYLLLCAGPDLLTLWTTLKEAGSRFGLLPIGYRTADLCKMENRVISQHHEGAAASNVLELNTRTMLAREKDSHAGREALQAVLDTGVSRRLVGITLPETVPEADGVTPGTALTFSAEPIGKLVNVGYSFAMKRWIGLALIDEAYACVGVQYDVQAGHATVPATTVSAPFLFNKSLTIRPQEDSYFT